MIVEVKHNDILRDTKAIVNSYSSEDNFKHELRGDTRTSSINNKRRDTHPHYSQH